MCRYYISSILPDAAAMLNITRQHWGVENKLHWMLDVNFGEDASPKRAGNTAQNFSVTNRIALNLLQNKKTKKLSIKRSGSPQDGNMTIWKKYYLDKFRCVCPGQRARSNKKNLFALSNLSLLND